METQEALQPTSAMDLETIRSRVKELSDAHRRSSDISSTSPSKSEEMIEDCVLDFERKIKQIMTEYSDFETGGIDDLDALLERAKEELNLVQTENMNISDEINVLTRTVVEDSAQLESNIEGLNCSLEFVDSLDLERMQKCARDECFLPQENQRTSVTAHDDYNFEILELNHQIEKSQNTLRSLQDLDYMLKRFEVTEKMEDTLSSLKVIEFEGNCIRLSIMTSIPISEGLLCQQKMEEIIETSVVDHELLIEVMDGTMELKSVEIFPNDVYIGEIIDVAKSFRQFSSPMPTLGTRSSLEWFVRKVQDRIFLCTLRRILVKDANKLRHTFEYLDRDETITAHMVGGIDAFIKVGQGWPISTSALKLIALKSSDHCSKGISLSFLCKVEELANSLDVQIRQSLPSFMDALEEILVKQMRSELHSDRIAEQ